MRRIAAAERRARLVERHRLAPPRHATNVVEAVQSVVVAENGVAEDPGAWIDTTSAAALEALAARGTASTSELAGDHPLLAVRLRLGVGTRWETEVGTASRILLLLAAEGAIVRDRPRGSWVASHYRWAPTERLGVLERLEPAHARQELLRRWLEAFGPATEADIRWWTGWSARRASRPLRRAARRRRARAPRARGRRQRRDRRDLRRGRAARTLARRRPRDALLPFPLERELRG
jgi:hypothetical protein